MRTQKSELGSDAAAGPCHIWTRTPVVWLLVLLALAAVWASPARAQAVRERPGATTADPTLYDLQRDERLGGHTLARHVGRTDAQLADRLRRENVSAASTWADELTARRTVALAIQQSRDRIRAWESRQGSRPNLVLNYVQPAGPPLGRSMRRRDPVSRTCDRAVIVLRWLERDRRWIVLTSYPETRR